MVKIYLNGKSVTLLSGTTLQDFLSDNDFTQGYFAVAINGDFIARTRYADVIIHSGDRIEVVTAMCGG